MFDNCKDRIASIYTVNWTFSWTEMPVAYLIHGFIGSGKTIYAVKLEN